jgi:hypothetical protein
LKEALSKGSIDGLQLEEQYGVLKSSRSKPESRSLLLNAVEDKHPYIQTVALESLGAAGKNDKIAVRAMLRWIATSDEFISSTAVEALSGIDTGNAALVEVLSEGMAHPNRTVRYSAAHALRRFGVAAKPALPTLITALRDVDQAEGLFGACLEVLRNLGPTARDAAPVILKLLPERSVVYQNKDKFTAHYLRAFMLLTLTEIDGLEQAGPFILDGLANSQGHLYAASARAAAKSPELWQQALPFLRAALQPDFPDHFLTFERFFARFSSNENYTSARIEAIKALAKMGPAARSAGPQLAKLVAESPQFMGNKSLIADEATKALRAVGN